jgi:glycosyltransferase involved in cell wall biosynthesis
MVLIGNIRTDGRVQKEILSLRKKGFTVTLIQWAHSGEGGGHEHLGIQVIDYPHRLHSNPAMNFLHQVLFNIFAWRHIKKLSPDFLQCNDLNTLFAGYLSRRQTRVIYDAHELYAESRTGLRYLAWSWLEKAMLPACYAIIQPEKHRLAYFAAKHGIESERMILIENFPKGDYHFSGRDRLRECFALSREVVILLYTGVLGPGRDIESMVTCMTLLGPGFVLVLLGPTLKGYRERLIAHIAKMQVGDRVKLHPEIPNAEMLDYIHSGDIGLVFYRNINLNNYWCASNKLYEFILCRKPVITNDYPGLREVVEERRLGICLSETSPEAIASAIHRLSERLPSLPPSTPYRWECQETSYLNLFEVAGVGTGHSLPAQPDLPSA